MENQQFTPEPSNHGVERFREVFKNIPSWLRKIIESSVFGAGSYGFGLLGSRLMQTYPLLGIVIHALSFTCIFLIGYFWLPESWFKKTWVLVLYTYFGSMASVFVSAYIDF